MKSVPLMETVSFSVLGSTISPELVWEELGFDELVLEEELGFDELVLEEELGFDELVLDELFVGEEETGFDELVLDEVVSEDGVFSDVSALSVLEVPPEDTSELSE